MTLTVETGRSYRVQGSGMQDIPNRTRSATSASAFNFAAETFDQNVPNRPEPVHKPSLAQGNPDLVHQHVSTLEVCDFEVLSCGYGSGMLKQAFAAPGRIRFPNVNRDWLILC